MTLVDTHCHLDFDVYNNDREKVILRAKQAGIEKIIVPGIDLNNCQKVLKYCEVDKDLYAAVGVHPNSALTWDKDSAPHIEDLARDPKVVAIGEIGLDFYREKTPKDIQKRVFLEHLCLADRLNLPVIIHSRQAEPEILDILCEWMDQRKSTGQTPGVLHSFMGDESTALRAISLGFFIGITGAVTFRNAKQLQNLVISLPLNNLLVETDAPFLSPHPNRGKRNEPAYVLFVAEQIARLKNIPISEVAETTTTNAERLFQWS